MGAENWEVARDLFAKAAAKVIRSESEGQRSRVLGILLLGGMETWESR